MTFIRFFLFILGVLAAFFLGWIGIVGLPNLQLASAKPPQALRPYTEEQLRGRAVYIREGCIYCHSQQTRPDHFGADQQKGWGRASVPADYAYDRPHLLGTMRTGPDLFNIATRQPSKEWHYLHLYDPRRVTPESIMPAYPWLFESGPADGQNVVPTDEGKALVAYLLSLDHTYPITPAGNDTTRTRK